MDLTRTSLKIGPLPAIHFYGLVIVIGLLAGASVAAWLAKKDKRDPDQIWNGLVWAIIFGVIGARIWYVLFPSEASVQSGKDTAWLLKNFFDLNDGPLAIWSGGLGIFGAFIGGLIGILLYAWWSKATDLIGWLDIAVIGFPLGHAIGRWGNYINEELYGKQTDLPWGIHISHDPANLRYHPLFLYESLWNLVVFGFLLWLWHKHRERLKKGDFLLLYLMLYPAMRFMLEFLRLEVAHIQGTNINSSQFISATAVIIAGSLFIYRHWDDFRHFKLPSRKPKFHPDGRPVGRSKKEQLMKD